MDEETKKNVDKKFADMLREASKQRSVTSAAIGGLAGVGIGSIFGGGRAGGKSNAQASMLKEMAKKQQRDRLVELEKNRLHQQRKAAERVQATMTKEEDLPAVLSKEGQERLQKARYLFANRKHLDIAMELLDVVLIELEHGAGSDKTKEAVAELNSEPKPEKKQEPKESENYEW